MKILFIAIFSLLILSQVTVSAEKDYTDLVKFLQQKIKESPFKGSSYNRLAYITDSFGPRMWGSVVLEQVIHQMLNYAQEEQFDNIRLESVSNFTKWVRGKESLIMLSPRPTQTKLSLTALGGSVAG
jgi:carboxypeptidase Q